MDRAAKARVYGDEKIAEANHSAPSAEGVPGLWERMKRRARKRK
jgi:hypothetical protein